MEVIPQVRGSQVRHQYTRIFWVIFQDESKVPLPVSKSPYLNMAEIKIAFWNCSGLLPTSSAKQKMDFLKSFTNQKFDLLILIETHHKVLDEISPLLRTYSNDMEILHSEATAGDSYAGIAVLVNTKLTLLEHTSLLRGRLLNFKLKCQSKKVYNISVIYGYTGKSASQTRMKEMTDYLVSYHKTSDNNIVLGDFNFVEDDLDRTNRTKTGKNQTDNILSKTWGDLIAELGLSDPFRVRNPNRRVYSYIHTKDNSKSRIDRIYMNDENCNEVLLYKHVPTMFRRAHKIITFSLKEGCERGPGFWKMNISILKDQAYETLVEKTINDVISLNIPDPIERWLIFKETIKIDTIAYSTRKRGIERRIKNICERKIDILEQNPLLGQNIQLHEEHEFYLSKLNDWHRKQIEGHQTRIKTQPRLEPGEPNISFFADLERKESKKKNITHLMDSNGNTRHDTEGMKDIATEYYTKLFDTKITDTTTSQRLLRNIVKKITPQQRANLDMLINREELEKAVRKLQKNKTPGPDGLPAEFYQTYWHILDDHYFEFINAVSESAFPKEVNTSITSLSYKEKGEVFHLANYRPIALMNVDMKIATKVLSRRLQVVLPTIIHESQTAVHGRQIGNSIHLVRDLIDYANKNDEGAAFLFLDQEKAFDRVSHTFLFDALQAYGFGDSFIHWIQILYSNAYTKISINGFLTKEIHLQCGVRQGCPLSPLLYVMVIEVLALQLRANPNIVGFNIEGEKIVSTHYADDAVIKITQNRCFKEVYKELKDYEKATGARLNYNKTVGLWVGKWKGRTDDPFHDIDDVGLKKIKWTNKNVKYLGVYVGNDLPDLQTFQEIIPKMKKRLHFWKPLQLPLLGKARVIEIYHASKLFYASNFYPIPPDIEREATKAFMDYITFPKKGNIPQVSRKEMEKVRPEGGIKLINLALKSQTPKVHWLIRILSDESLKVQLHLFNSLIGVQSGQLTGQDIIFAENSYVKRNLRTENSFYKEALDGITKLIRGRHYLDVNDLNVFFNPIFTSTVEDEVHEQTIKPFRGNRILSAIKSYGDLLAAEVNVQCPNLKAAVRKKIESIDNIKETTTQNLIYSLKGAKEYTFAPTYKQVTQKIIYEELILNQSGEHTYKTKWIDGIEEGRLPDLLDWDKVWESVHKQFYTEKVKSTIWEQIHLNFYTTYSYNKWHKSLLPCPLCNKIPEDIFHVILDCRFTKVMWKRIEKVLLKILPIPITLSEKALGLQPRRKKETEATILRNWITFSLRQLIIQEERKAYHITDYHLQSVERFFCKYNYATQEEIRIKKLQYDFRGLSHKFEKIVTINNAIVSINAGEYIWKNIM